MAVSLTSPCCSTDKALAAAPVPRPPQPTRAICTVLSSAACTAGTTMLVKAEAAAIRPVFCKNSRRDVVCPLGSLIGGCSWFALEGGECRSRREVGSSLGTKRRGLSRFFGALGEKWDCPPLRRPQALKLLV